MCDTSRGDSVRLTGCQEPTETNDYHSFTVLPESMRIRLSILSSAAIQDNAWMRNALYSASAMVTYIYTHLVTH